MKSQRLWGTLLMILAAGSLHATMMVWNSLVQMEQNADLIVVGAAGHGTRAVNGLSFTIQVGRVVKGDPATAGSAIAVGWADSGQGAWATSPGDVAGTGLWFLQRAPAGWLLMPVVQGGLGFARTFIAAPSGPILSAYAYEAGASLSDKVASEVSAAIEGADGGGAQLNPLPGGLLDDLGSPVVQVLYQRMAASSSTKQQILGLAGQIRWGNAAALGTAAQAGSSFTAFGLENGVLLESVQHGFRAADPASVGILGQIVVNPSNANLPFRRAAAFALAAIHTKEALPYLAELMEDADPELRAESVRGLGSFANGLPVQTMAGTPSLSYLQPQPNSAFRTDDTVTHHPLNIQYIEENESKYLTFWKAWWQTNRAALGY